MKTPLRNYHGWHLDGTLENVERSENWNLASLRLYKVVYSCTRLHRGIQSCTRLYTVVHSCTRLYKVYKTVHCCTRLYKLYNVVQSCTRLNKVVQVCTQLYKVIKTCRDVYTDVHCCTRFLTYYMSEWYIKEAANQFQISTFLESGPTPGFFSVSSKCRPWSLRWRW